MRNKDARHLFVLGYPERGKAEAAIVELTELQRDQFLEVTDYAIISKGADGRVTVDESKAADPGARRGAVAGVAGGALVALAATPIGLGAIAVGAGVGAVAGALRDSGFKRDDLDEVAALVAAGRTLLLVVVKPEHTDRLRSVLDDIPEFRASDRRWEFEAPPEAKQILHEALEAYRAGGADEASQAGSKASAS